LLRAVEHTRIIQEKLTEIIKVEPKTKARSVKKMIAKELIKSTPDKNNKKIKKLYPTDRGKKVYPFILREHHYSNQVAVKGLSQQEVLQLHTLLQKVRKNVSEDWHYIKKGNKRIY